MAIIDAKTLRKGSDILDHLRFIHAIGVAEILYKGSPFWVYYGDSRAIWKQSSQPAGLSVADAIAGMVERIDDPALRRRNAVAFAKANLPQEVFELLGLLTD